MKLLIEIPEEQYRTLNAKSQNDIVTAIDDALLIKAIRNGKPLDSVLDEIKTEIEDYESDCNYHLSEEDNCRTCNKITFGSIYRIIDKYKAESEEEKMKKIRLFSTKAIKSIEGDEAELYVNFYLVLNKTYGFTFLIDAPNWACTDRHPIKLWKDFLIMLEEENVKYMRRYEETGKEG